MQSGVPGFEAIEGLDVLEMDEKLDFEDLSEKLQFEYELIPTEADSDEDIPNKRCRSSKGIMEIIPGEAVGYYIKSEGDSTKLVQFDDSPKKDEIGRVVLRVLSSFEREHTVQLQDGSTDVLKNVTDLVKGALIPTGKYQLTIDNSDVITCNDTQKFELDAGGVYVILLDEVEANDYV